MKSDISDIKALLMNKHESYISDESDSDDSDSDGSDSDSDHKVSDDTAEK